MSNIAIYNLSGEIIQTGIVPDGIEAEQAGDNRFVYIGITDPEIHKIVNGERTDKTQTEINEYRLVKRYAKRPLFSGSETEDELNQIIDNHFYGLIDVVQYRVDNYFWIREKFYPKISDYIDANVKSNSGISELVEIGQDQVETYVQACLNVKARFPKT